MSATTRRAAARATNATQDLRRENYRLQQEEDIHQAAAQTECDHDKGKGDRDVKEDDVLVRRHGLDPKRTTRLHLDVVPDGLKRLHSDQEHKDRQHRDELPALPHEVGGKEAEQAGVDGPPRFRECRDRVP
jgi:hypothetical protein